MYDRTRHICVKFKEEFYATVICDDYCSDDDTIMYKTHGRARCFTSYDKSDTNFTVVQDGRFMTPVYVIRARLFVHACSMTRRARQALPTAIFLMFIFSLPPVVEERVTRTVRKKGRIDLICLSRAETKSMTELWGTKNGTSSPVFVTPGYYVRHCARGPRYNTLSLSFPVCFRANEAFFLGLNWGISEDLRFMARNDAI